MEIDVISGQFYVTIDWSSIDQYQSIPINWLVSIDIDWSISFPMIDFHRLYTPGLSTSITHLCQILHIPTGEDIVLMSILLTLVSWLTTNHVPGEVNPV